MPEVSIIVPIYNSEKYLNKCIDSVLAQSFDDFELILVDDGSTDSSGNICDKYADQDSRVKVIHKQNSGVASARNIGLKIACGKYIMFCDSDDYAEREWVKVLYEHALKYPDCLINCEYSKVNAKTGENKEFVLPDTEEVTYYPLSEFFYMYKYAFAFSLWNAVFSMDIIRKYGLKFDESMEQSEDVIFNLEYIKCCSGFLYIPQVLYCWVDNSVDTLSRRFHPRYFDHIKQLFYPRLELIDEKNLQDYYDEYFYRFYLCFDYVTGEKSTLSRREKIKYCNYILHDETFQKVLNHASDSACSPKLRKILKLKSYRVLKLFTAVASLPGKNKTTDESKNNITP